MNTLRKLFWVWMARRHHRAEADALAAAYGLQRERGESSHNLRLRVWHMVRS